MTTLQARFLEEYLSIGTQIEAFKNHGLADPIQRDDLIYFNSDQPRFTVEGKDCHFIGISSRVGNLLFVLQEDFVLAFHPPAMCGLVSSCGLVSQDEFDRLVKRPALFDALA